LSKALHNTLTDPLIRVEMIDNSQQSLSLPEVYTALANDSVVTFPALRPHQAPAWMAFLTQIAAMGMEALGRTQQPGNNPTEWVKVLRALTPDHPNDEPWCLIAPLARPALLQAPGVADDLANFKTVETPDDLDMLVTSKNHDFKAEQLAVAKPDDWLFALVSLQTQEGAMGKGNYGIARMNGGYGSRPFVSVRADDARPGTALMHDLHALVASTNKLRDDAATLGIGTEAAIPLVWTEPWGDSAPQLSLAKLHPLFVEICRRIRLELSNGKIVARKIGSKTTRIAAAERKGNLADPWAPIEIGNEPKVLSITKDGFSYRRVCDLLFGSTQRNYRLPLLATVRTPAASRELVLDMAALARGQGKTEGFHVRQLPIPSRAASVLEAGNTGLAERARERIKDTGEAVSKCLRPALIALVQKGRAEIDWKKPSNTALTEPWLGRFDNAIDQLFFPELWNALDSDDEVARRNWAILLAREARRTLDAAAEAGPCTDERRVIALARAGNRLEGALRNCFPALRDSQRDEVGDA